MKRGAETGIGRGVIPAAGGRRLSASVLAATPALALGTLVVLLGVLFYYVERDEESALRVSLINDALWVEQTLRFQLSTDEDHLARLALDAPAPGDGAADWLGRVRLILGNNPEIESVMRLDETGRPILAVPPVAADAPLPEAVQRLRGYASASLMRPVYGDLRRGPAGGLLVDVAAPVAGAGEARGVVVATVSLSVLLARHVPWWIAEKYAVRLTDANGTVLIEKTRTVPDGDAPSHGIAFDPPLRGTYLTVTPYRIGTERLNNVLIGSILGLAALAVVSLVVLQRHVRHRLSTEQRLATEITFRRAMEDSLTVGMRARDLDGRMLYVNSAFARMVGWSVEELVGLAPPMPYWDPDLVEDTMARHRALMEGKPAPQSFETRFRRRDGTPFYVQVYEAPLIDAAGRHQGWMGSIIDITEAKAVAEMKRNQAESLQRTGRLVTLGEMASSLAHELNQPLAAIASYAAGTLNLLRAGEAVEPGALEKIAQQASRAGEIIRRIQDLVRKRQPRFEPVDLARVVEETVAFAAVDARNAARIEALVAPDLPVVVADGILLEQLLLNLIRNGIEAMAHLPPEERRLVVEAGERGGAIELKVMDRGAGIDTEEAEHLFELFVSTKPEGMGMGLGICRSIVELHKGRIEHAARPGGGTVFTITLPLVRETVAA